MMTSSHLANLLGFITSWGELSATNHIAESTICSATPEVLGYFSTFLAHELVTANYEFVMKPDESAECHQTLSLLGGSGHETNTHIALKRL